MRGSITQLVIIWGAGRPGFEVQLCCVTLGKSLNLSESQFTHLFNEDIHTYLTGQSWDFKAIYVKCLCFVERTITIAENGVGTGLYLE